MNLQKNITLNPVDKWLDQDSYRIASNKLIQLFKTNFLNLYLGENTILEKGRIYN